MSIAEQTENVAVAQPTTVTYENQPLRDIVMHAVMNYFKELGDQPLPGDIYDTVLEQVEPPLLTAVMRYTRGNQSRAAILLGISRGTLRKKLKQYDID